MWDFDITNVIQKFIGDVILMLLYHGSKQELDYLAPHQSFHDKPYVYASSDFCYALVRCGNFDEGLWVREDYHDGKYQIAELTPFAFEHLFNRDGHLYTLDDESFTHYGWCMDNEYVSSKEKIVPTGKLYIPNIWQEMQKYWSVYELIANDQVGPDYWANVTGGMEGYLKRREERQQLLKNFSLKLNSVEK